MKRGLSLMWRKQSDWKIKISGLNFSFVSLVKLSASSPHQTYWALAGHMSGHRKGSAEYF